jgi:hypothetical protein
MAAEKLAAVEAEVAAEVDDGAVVVELVTDDGAEDIRVPRSGSWKSRAQNALAQGLVETWAELVLSPEDREKWEALDPTLDDCEDFFERWKELAGQDLKKSQNSRPSSRSTRRR